MVLKPIRQMTVKGHMRRLPTKRYHKSLVFHPPYPLALRCKLEFLPHPVIASIGHIGRLRHKHTHTRSNLRCCPPPRQGHLNVKSSGRQHRIALRAFLPPSALPWHLPNPTLLDRCECNIASPTCKRRMGCTNKG